MTGCQITCFVLARTQAYTKVNMKQGGFNLDRNKHSHKVGDESDRGNSVYEAKENNSLSSNNRVVSKTLALIESWNKPRRCD